MPIALGVLLPGAQPVRTRSLNAVWRGRARLADGQVVPVHVKRLQPAALLAECTGSWLARAAGLNTPEPMLVSDPQQQTGHSEHPLFGSPSAPHQSVQHWIDSEDDRAVQERFYRWRHLRRCCALDEALANPDRHFGNLLWDGEAEFLPIDHDLCFGGPLRHPARPIGRDEAVRNQLAERLYKKFGPVMEGPRLAKFGERVGQRWRKIDLSRLADDAALHHTGATQHAPDVLALLAWRLAAVGALLKQRAHDAHNLKLPLPPP